MLLIKNAVIQSPGAPLDGKKRDVLIKKGIIESIRAKIEEPRIKTFDAKGAFISPGWMDIGVQVADPGYEHREDLESINRAAAAGGFTAIASQPNTQPTIQSKSEIHYLKSRMDDALVDIYPFGAVSENCQGKDITEIYDMHQAGAIAFTDGKRAIQNGGLMMRALQYVKAIDGIIVNPVFDESIGGSGQIHEGQMSTSLGMKGIPSLAEELMLQRDIYLLEYTASRLHVANISCAGSVELIGQAKKRGARISASVPAMNLVFTDEKLASFDTNFKVLPPLREATDVKALIKGIKSGVIDFISSNHIPWEGEHKNLEFPYAKFGAIGLETLFPLVHTFLRKQLTVTQLVTLLAINPRKVFDLEVPEIKEGANANLTIFNTNDVWKFSQADIYSKSSNTPFIGHEFVGRVLGVVNNGKVFLND